MKQTVKLVKVASMIGLSSLFVACAHYHDVRPLDNGDNSVSFYTEVRGQGYREAISQASYYCSQHFGSQPYVLSENSSYVGNIPEQEYLQGKKAANTMETIGIAGIIFGNENIRSAGTVLAITGDIAHQTMGPGYLYSLRFRCD